MFFFDGLVVLFIFAGSLYFCFAKVVGRHILHVAKACGVSVTPGLADIGFLGGLMVVIFLAFLFWHRKRSVPKFSENELGILFAPDFDEEVEKEVNRLFVHLRQEIKLHEIGNRLSLKRMPPNLSISSPEEAKAIIKDAGGAVAVWGPIEEQASNK
jgi:hypothetical protein